MPAGKIVTRQSSDPPNERPRDISELFAAFCSESKTREVKVLLMSPPFCVWPHCSFPERSLSSPELPLIICSSNLWVPDASTYLKAHDYTLPCLLTYAFTLTYISAWPLVPVLHLPSTCFCLSLTHAASFNSCVPAAPTSLTAQDSAPFTAWGSLSCVWLMA